MAIILRNYLMWQRFREEFLKNQKKIGKNASFWKRLGGKMEVTIEFRHNSILQAFVERLYCIQSANIH